MNPFVRFWVIILSLAISVTAFAYLFISFFFPDPAVVQTAPEVRIGATLAILVFGGIFVWAMLFVSLDDGSTVHRTEPDRTRNQDKL